MTSIKQIKRLLSYYVFWLVLMLVISGCGSINKRMQSWVGRHQSELIQKVGPPDMITTDGAGGSILIYSSYVNTGQTPGRASYYGNTVRYTAPQNTGYVRKRMYYVNSEGIIYSWRWQGL